MKVTIDQFEYDKIMFFVNKSSDEISGMGRLVVTDYGYHVTKIYLLKQVNSGSTTEIDAESMTKLMFDSRKDLGYLNFWWHSHAQMPVFWSRTDHETINKLGGEGFVLATVFNQKGETRTALKARAGGYLPEIFIDDIPFSVIHETGINKVELEAEFLEKCSKKEYNFKNYEGWQYEDDNERTIPKTIRNNSSNKHW